jgi:hypothetical protein
VPGHQVGHEYRRPTGGEDAHDGAVDDESALHGPIVGPNGEVGEVYGEIEYALARFATLALPSRLDDKTPKALEGLIDHDAAVGPTSVATGAVYGQAITRGTIEFPGFSAQS